MEQEQQTPHKRRVRYKGKYPKKFEEKYKELQPEKYQDTIEHVIKKGNTPAGMHISIMVQEILDTLKIQPGETGFDATLGYGGHTKAMLACLNGQGHIYATDVDPEESAKTKKRLEELGYGEDILTIRLQNFCTIDEIAKEVGGFDFILADLGVSSMQIDNPKRGFSFKVDGPLDLRLNQEAGISAAERLDTITREELAGMLYENSDEPYCEELAKAITDEIRKGSRIDTTTKLREVIEKTLDFLPEKEKKDTIKKTCQRTFQALRIDVNREFEVLYEFMEKLPDALKPGGRVAILTFHSGEDKLVKKALKEGCRAGIYADYSKDGTCKSSDESLFIKNTNLDLLKNKLLEKLSIRNCRTPIYIEPLVRLNANMNQGISNAIEHGWKNNVSLGVNTDILNQWYGSEDLNLFHSNFVQFVLKLYDSLILIFFLILQVILDNNLCLV